MPLPVARLLGHSRRQQKRHGEWYGAHQGSQGKQSEVPPSLVVVEIFFGFAPKTTWKRKTKHTTKPMIAMFCRRVKVFSVPLVITRSPELTNEVDSHEDQTNHSSNRGKTNDRNHKLDQSKTSVLLLRHHCILHGIFSVAGGFR
jgi:hypothetical protein